jgi:single-strand DNA-binding protein
MNVNKVFLLGRITASPEIRKTPTGQSVSSFTIATNRVWTDKTGRKQQETEFHNVVVWGRQAEIAVQFLTKGSLVFVEGRLRTRSWQDKQGQNRFTTEIICERLQLGPKPMGVSKELTEKDDSFNLPQDIETKETDSLEIPVINLDEEKIDEDLPF